MKKEDFTLKRDNYPLRASFARRRMQTTINCEGGMTEQWHKEACDINQILHDYQRTGFVRHAKEHAGKYDDISMQDFQSAMELVTRAKHMFEGLPSSIRKRFNNDPGQFHHWARTASEEELNRIGVSRGVDGLDVDGRRISKQEVLQNGKPNDPVGKQMEPPQTTPAREGQPGQAPKTGV